MTRDKLLYCATDKEIYDALMSAKKKIDIALVLNLAKDRGIFYSPQESREALISNLSLLPHDYYDLNVMLDHRDHLGRVEKLTSVVLSAKLTIGDIQEVAKEYVGTSTTDELATSHSVGMNQYVVNVCYSEVDHSKTRLVQRIQKEAKIEFQVEDGRTIIRMPANEKAKEIVEKLKQRLEEKQKAAIPVDLIEIGEFTTSEARTEFFTLLISQLNGFKLSNVTSVKVEPIKQAPGGLELDPEEDDDDEREAADEDALALIQNVALRGGALLSSEEYQSLVKKGFFITEITWQSTTISAPNQKVEFSAAFDEPTSGKGFKYAVRGVYNFSGGEYTKTMRPVKDERRQVLVYLLEQSASNALAVVREKLKVKDVDGNPAGATA